MRRNILTVTLFTSAIAAVFVINMLLPDKMFSDRENRNLQTWPIMSLATIKSGKWAENIEDYVVDQFLLRDQFIWAKAELELLLGKQENNGVFLSKANTLIEKMESPDYEVVDANIKAISQLKDSVDIPVYTGIVPGQSLVWSKLLPDNAPNYNQNILLDYVDSHLEDVIDMSVEINSNDEEYIYYYTDHHWTTLGAYYGYKSICESICIEATPMDNYTETMATDDFLGSWYNQSGIARVEKDTIHLYVPNQEAVAINGTEENIIKIYEESYIESHDKYSLFFGGNHSIVKVDGQGDENVLFIKDSYSNSMVPYFIDNFQEIHMIDLRYMRDCVSDYIDKNNIDQVIICYSASNFTEDKNLQLMN